MTGFDSRFAQSLLIHLPEFVCSCSNAERDAVALNNAMLHKIDESLAQLVYVAVKNTPFHVVQRHLLFQMFTLILHYLSCRAFQAKSLFNHPRYITILPN
jgi:hypothetical protein